MTTEQDFARRAFEAGVPEHTVGGLARYIMHGVPPGDFLLAFLENDLMDALGRADDINRRAFFEIGSFLYSAAPRDCYRSRAKVEAWIKAGGLAGLRAKVEEV